MRDQEWLERRAEQIWKLFFPDIEKRDVSVVFKGKWKNKFGHIKKKKNRRTGKEETEIAINSLFSNLKVPEYVVQVTLAHEIVHYMHGFFSHLPKKHKYPHKGRVVDKVLEEKGFGYMLRQEKEWVKKEWWNVYKEISGKERKRIEIFGFRF